MGDPLAAYVTERTTDEQYEMLAEKHGINEPIYVQYFTYLKSVITFDWGYSEVLNEDVLLKRLKQFHIAACYVNSLCNLKGSLVEVPRPI